jgi:hypothetical protein
MLRRTAGLEDGIVDALIEYTSAEAGAYDFCPVMVDRRQTDERRQTQLPREEGRDGTMLDATPLGSIPGARASGARHGAGPVQCR